MGNKLQDIPSDKRVVAAMSPNAHGGRVTAATSRKRYAATSLEDQHAGPCFHNWVLLGIGTIFVLCGVILLFDRSSSPGVGIVTIAFFGLGVVMHAAIIIRKLRLRRSRPLRVEIVGGVPIRPSRTYYLAAAVAMSMLGGGFIVSGDAYPEVIRFTGWPLAIAGCAVLFGLAIGRLPIGHLQFDPSGITISRGRWAYTIPWDGIASMHGSELSEHHPVLLIRPHHDDVVSVHPPARKRSLTRHFAWNMHRAGAPIVIMASQYGMDLPLLIQALNRYIAVPSARMELSRRHLE
jgi:hypothetical protein